MTYQAALEEARYQLQFADTAEERRMVERLIRSLELRCMEDAVMARADVELTAAVERRPWWRFWSA